MESLLPLHHPNRSAQKATRVNTVTLEIKLSKSEPHCTKRVGYEINNLTKVAILIGLNGFAWLYYKQELLLSLEVEGEV